MNKHNDDRCSLLIVDDNPNNLRVLSEVLMESGFELRFAEDGTSALEQIDYAHPNLILLDVMMPGIDGFETCRRLKQREDTRDIPVIFMSALTDTVDKVRGLELGAVDYIAKPFQHEEVLARINTHLTLQLLKRRLQESEERLSCIIESAMDAIITLDRNGHIILFNPAAEQMFGFQACDVVNRPLVDFLTERFRQWLNAYLSGSKTDRRAGWVPEGMSAVRANGEGFPIEASISRAEAAGQTLYTLILRDINERKKAEAERNRLEGLTVYLQEEMRAAHEFQDLIGESPAMRRILQDIERVAATDATVLVLGETGTGKELIARAIHNLSTRKDKVLVKVNCAAIPESLAESELFGHEKGAFTGAIARKMGRFELAEGGTIFFDEIGELPFELQAKLLRVLQEEEFERVGGTHTLKANVRVIAATHLKLEQAARQGTFRADLFYRLHVFPIQAPALRERKDDIVLLVRHFVQRYALKYGRPIHTVPAPVMRALEDYPWPGNIRELQHIIERAVILSQEARLEVGDWFRTATPAPPAASTPTLEAAERAHIVSALERADWRIRGERGAAALLALKPTTLESKMKKLGLTRK